MYLIVLGAAAIVTILGLSALTVVRIQRRSATDLADAAEARLYARSAIEFGRLVLDSDPDWRQNRPDGSWVNEQPIGRGTFSLGVVDPVDGDISAGDNDPLVLTGTGQVGDARHKLSVRLIPEPPPGLNCLASAVHVGGDANFSGSVSVTAPVSCNDDIYNSGWIVGDVEAGDSVTNPGIILGTVTEGTTAKDMPDGNVFDRYSPTATPINRTSLFLSGGEYYMRNGVLSPASNPFGATTNANGLYVIDCLGANLVITNIRIVGTLLVLRPGSGSRTQGALHWEPARSDYPALLVDGDFGLQHSSGLNESALGVNYNPPGTPYQLVEDSDLLDAYPNLSKGLYYMWGTVAAGGTVVLEGVLLVGENLGSSSSLLVQHDANLINNPPAGFERTNRPMIVDPGTWGQLID